MIKEVIKKHNIREKLALLVTDNGSNMLKARHLVVNCEGYLHILEMRWVSWAVWLTVHVSDIGWIDLHCHWVDCRTMPSSINHESAVYCCACAAAHSGCVLQFSEHRCAMHGFNLVLGSIMAFPWAKDLVVRSQQVVTYFRASHQAMAVLRAAAAKVNVRRELHSSNTTRMTSSNECTSSVQANSPAFTVVLQSDDAAAIKSAAVLAILKSREFWESLEQLNKLLEPLSVVIMAVQGHNTTLADVCRCGRGLLLSASTCNGANLCLVLLHHMLQVIFLCGAMVVSIDANPAS
jgi:hypothetical protein